MAGTVESSIVLNAVDNTKSALNSVQQGLSKLTQQTIDLQKGLSDADKALYKMVNNATKIDTKGLTGFQLEIAKCNNQIVEYENKLLSAKEGTQLYTTYVARLESAQKRLAEAKEGLTRQTEEERNAIQQDNEALQENVQEMSLVEQAEQKHISALQRVGNFLSEKINKMFSHKESIMSNSEAMKYWEEQIKRVENELAQAEQQLATMDSQVGTSSDELQRQREYVRELEQQLKEYKKELKDTTANMSPFQLALQKLGKNIKSLFLLHAAKGVLDGMRKAFKWAVNEMIEGGLKLEQVAGNFDHLAEVSGMDAIKLRNALREASHNMVSDVDLMQSTSKAMLLGVGGNVENLANLMKIAEVRGAQMGQSTTKSFDDVVLGIGRLSPKILDNLGIIVSLTDAYEIYAEKVGKSTDELTKQEQQIALTEEVLRQSQQQLLDWEQKNLSISEKLTQIQTRLKNALAQVGASFLTWLTPVIDKVNELSARTYKMSDDVVKDIQATSSKIPNIIARAIEEVWDITETLVENTWDIFKELFETIGEGLNGIGMLYSAVSDAIGTTNSDTITGMAGDWTDIFYFINLGIAGIAMAFKIAFKGVVGVIKATAGSIGAFVGRMTGSFDNAMVAIGYGFVKMAQSALDSIVQMVNKMVDWLNRIPEKLGLGKMIEGEVKGINIAKLLGIDNASMNAAKNIRDDFIGDIEAPRKDLWSDLNTEADEGVEKMMKIFENQVAKNERDKYSIEKKKSPRKNLDLNLDDDLGGGGGSSKKETDEMSESMKELIKEMEDYAKETSKIKEKNMDNIVASMEECVKEAEKLAKEVSKLQDELDKLGGEERQDIAEQYVKAEEQLKDLEEQYTNIKEAVEDLGEAYIKNDMGRDEKRGDEIDRKTLREYIDLQEQLKSAYEGLNDEGVKLLDEQIKKQKEYNELNDIEKIKYDYAEKRKAIEEDIAEKQALIEKELEKYKGLKDEKIAYEKEWLNYMQWSATKQMEWQQKLINQAERLLELRREAGLAGGGNTGHRAGGGVVYGGESYIVGEHGPELFTPNVSGKITPNNQITNNNGIEVNITGVSVRNEGDINALADEIVRRIKLEKNFGIS